MAQHHHKPKPAFFMAVILVIAALVGLAVWRFGAKKSDDSDPTARSEPKVATPTTPVPSAGAVEITFEYSTEKKDWIEASLAAFAKLHPEIHVRLVGKGSLEAAQAILDGTDQPTVWSPADSLVANLLASDWKTKNNSVLYAAAPEPLLLSPLVFVVWEDRAKVLGETATGQLSWKAIHTAVGSAKGWPGIGGKPGWGFVKLGHTDPNRSNSGLEAIVLMAYEYFNITSGLTVDQLLDPKFQDFVREIELGVSHFEASTGTFMTDMIRFGPSKYDIAVVYESLAVSQLENAQGRWGSLHVYYPPVTIWSDHPIVLLDSAKLTADQRAAAGKLVEFLRSTKVQSTALDFGFRPADPAVPMKSSKVFQSMAKYGFALELPAAAQPPEGPVVRNLLMMWSRVVKPK